MTRSEAKRHLSLQKWSEPLVFCTFSLGNVLRATTACTFSTSEPPKVVRACCVLYILTWKCASRHNSVHFFDISTSKSGPRMVCFVHFDLEMCFAPQQRALFRHRNFQKWSEPLVFCTFWLGNGLCATTACTFSTSQLPKVVRTWCALYILTSKCASRHNGVHFFISHLASWLRTRRFSEPTFRPSGAPNHSKKHSASRLSYLFAHLHLLSSYSFSSDLLSSNLPLLSASALLCFSSVHIVGCLTSKLPSTIYYITISPSLPWRNNDDLCQKFQTLPQSLRRRTTEIISGTMLFPPIATFRLIGSLGSGSDRTPTRRSAKTIPSIGWKPSCDRETALRSTWAGPC